MTEAGDGYNTFRLVNHTDCFLSYMIREVKKIQIKDLEEQTEKFKKIEKILDYKISKKKVSQDLPSSTQGR
jgi:hypothetical protein